MSSGESRYSYQKSARSRNIDKVMIILGHGPKRFRDILREADRLSQQTLSSILKELLNHGKIQKVIHEGSEAYSLTSKGKASLEETYYIINDLIQLKDRNALHLFNETIPGISESVTTNLSKNELDRTPFPISPTFIFNMSLSKMIKEIKKKKIDV